ncbi:hypothetical protein BJ322DRAFT_1001657 [Thelephora terrestris]|uniref:CUE domain-containing protein n=1 Tax=Thelephora terrestris TaxID=56493 RepID=A0A9P6HKE5_9AGAM|nr:hypothetical protein BJ322DRAFT_1001657 [Thelephora terrestris]
MTITGTLPPYPSKNAQKTLPRSQLSTLNQKIALGLAQVLDLPTQKRDDQSCREFVASYAQDFAFRTLEGLIWGKNDDLDPEKWTKDENLIQQRTLLLAERLAATKAPNSASLDLQTLLDLSIVFYPTHPSRIRSLFSTALATSPSLRIAVEMETIPAFTELFSPTSGAANTGLYGLRKAAQCLKSFVVASPPEFTRLFALNKEFVVALADAYHRGLSSLATSYGFTGSEDDPNAQDQKIFVETKVALMDAFHAMVKFGMVDAVVSGDSGAVQEVLEVLIALANLPTASSLQFPSHTVDVEPVPFLNRSLLEDYHDAYDFTKSLTTALKKKEREDARISLFEAHLCSIQAIGGKEPRPGALKVLLYSSGAPLPQFDRKGKERVGPTSVDAPPPAGRSDDLDMKVTQVLDVLPDTPPDYVRALLQHPDYPNPERVVEALLEGTAPPIADLIRTAVELPPPAQEQFVYTQGRRNIFDNQEIDLAHVRVGKKSGDTSAIPQERSEIERMKAYILRRVGEPSDEEEESDGDDYDEDHVVKVKLGGDGEESDEESGEKPEARDIETILELAYITDPKQFDRDPQTRRSQARAKLRAQTGWVDEQIEGWRIMLERNPSKDKILQKHEFSGNRPGTIEPLQMEGGSRQTHQMGEGSGHGRGWRGRGGRGSRGSARGGRGGGGGVDARDRAAKDKNKASRGNHNRKRGHDKKMARGGPPPT